MTKLPTLCVTLLLVTACHSDGETPVTMDTADSQPGESTQDMTNNSRPGESRQDQTYNSRPGEDPQDQPQVDHRQPGTSSPDLADNSGRSNAASIFSGISMGHDSPPRKSADLKLPDDFTNHVNSQDKSYGPLKTTAVSPKGGHHTIYAPKAPVVQPSNRVHSHANHLSSKQTSGQRYPSVHATESIPQPSAQTGTPVQPSSTVPHKPEPVGEGEVWSRDYGFYSVDLAACGSTQLHEIVIPLEEEVNMEVQWRVYGTDKATRIDTNSAPNMAIICKFRVVTKDSRYLAGMLDELDLSGGVQAGLNMTIAGGKKTQHLYLSVGDTITTSVLFPSLSSELTFTFQPSGGGHRAEVGPSDLTRAGVHFLFLLTQQSGFQLETGQISSNSGYIRTFAFDSFSDFHSFTLYAHNTDSVVRVTGTGVVISFPHFDLQDSPGCQADRLTLSRLQYTAHGAPEYTGIWSRCGNRYIPPQVYDHPLALHFVSDSSHSRTGFKMLYSIHPLTQFPQQLPSGLFNCSVSHYPDFRLHFHCNLERECVAGEDEADCPYTTTDCRPGHIHEGTTCYLYLPVRREITWYDANELCRGQREKLASLRTDRNWYSFIQALRYSRRTSPVYASLSMHQEDAEAVAYGSELHLSEENAALRSSLNDSDLPNTYCTYTPAVSHTYVLRDTPCNRSMYADFVLCEQEKTVPARRPKLEKREWWTVSPSGVHVNLTACHTALTKNEHYPLDPVFVEDGMRLEASGMLSTDLFVCHMGLFGKRNHSIATVIEAFEVHRNPDLPDNEKMDVFLVVRSGLDPFLNPLQAWDEYDESDFEYDFVVPSNDSTIFFNFQSEHGVKSMYLQLRILVTAQPGTDHLTHLPVPPRGGILTSFAFDGHTRYAHDTEASFWLDAGLMISFPHFDLEYDQGCRSDKLELSLYKYYWTIKSHFLEWTKCGREFIPPRVYSTSLWVTFTTGPSQARTGFKMLYSTHPLSQLPQQLPSGLLNCSVPHYPDFCLHIHCNLERECVAGEDEADCPYTTTDCGPSHIDAGNKCYLYLPVRGEIAWYDASQLCQSHGQRLVSPRTPSEWSTFRTITDYGKKTFGVFVGLSTSPPSLQAMYREVWRWEDKIMAFYLNARGQKLSKPTCAYLPPIYRDMLEPIGCGDQIYIHYVLCEKDKVSDNDSHAQVRPSDPPNAIRADSVSGWAENASGWTCNVSALANNLVHCPKAGHVTHSFLSCDFHVLCVVTQSVTSCPLSGGDSVPMFECDSGSWTVHYSLVCDHRQDCPDGSDEKWCQHAPCAPSHKPCKNKQCVLQKDWCDGMWHCVDGSDEDCLQSVRIVVPSVPPPAVVTLDGHGGYDTQALDPTQPCPMTHFRCSPRDYCLPVYLRCNGEFDCPGREDEEQCDRYTCPGLYRCRASSVCVHNQHVCDGVFQCPQQDDEWLCDVICPQGCRCQGLAFTCNQTFPAHAFPSLRYLDASGSGIRPRDLRQNHYLVRLSLSRCGLTAVENMTLPNLRWLDLSANTLTTVNMQTFATLTNLRVLRLAQNPVTSLVCRGVDTKHLNLHTLDLSFTELLTFHGQSLAGFPRLTHLNISHGALATITEQGLNSTPSLQVLDIRESPLDTFPQHLLRDLVSIHTMYADNFKLCCPAMLPDGFNPNNCHASLDEIASCDDLLRSDAYRVSLWFMAAMAVVGNVGSFVYRAVRKEAAKTDFQLFVSNLCLADLLMGLYLTVIGTADAVYRGEYLWNDKLWRGSAVCQVAGFLSLLSSEMSAFFICLITLDRFIVLRFPFSQVRFHTRSALAASALAWTVGCLLALVPLLPMTSHWRFYSQTGICIPLPITRTTFKGRAYSFGVMVVFNFVLFVLIALGQLLVFLSVRKNSMTGSRGKQDAIIARRLTIIVLSDFLCWFPIGLLGLLASTGTPISSELNVGMAIFVLPFNSALNPFLYTFNVLMEKRQKAAEARLLEKLCRQTGGPRSNTETSKAQTNRINC